MWTLCSGTAFAAVETKLNGLTWLDGTIPRQVRRRVRIVAAEIGIPLIGHFAAVSVAPVHIPAIDGGGAIILDAN